MTQTKPLPKRVKIIFGITLLCIGLVSALGGNQIQKIKYAYASMSWPCVEGTIVSSGVKDRTSAAHRGGKHISHTTSYFADITYEYMVKDKKYASKTISFGDYGNSNRARVENIVSRYPDGKKVKVFYNTADPHNACLEPGAPLSIYIPAGLGICMILIGVRLLYTITTGKNDE